jgi:hypothetical protein
MNHKLSQASVGFQKLLFDQRAFTLEDSAVFLSELAVSLKLVYYVIMT